MSQVTAAPAAVHFCSHHEMAAIDGALDCTVDRREETRPAGAAFELPLRHKQRLPAAGAGERAGPLLVQERTRPRPLGSMLAKHVVLLGRQGATPFLV